jgi:hypothetical protein
VLNFTKNCHRGWHDGILKDKTGAGVAILIEMWRAEGRHTVDSRYTAAGG